MLKFGEWKNERYTRRTLKELSHRAAVSAQLIKPNSSVLDLGCGHHLIVPHLPNGTRYYGVDKFPVAPDVPVIDLDRQEFPQGEWDYVLMLGLLSWVREPLWVLNRARQSCRHLIIAISHSKDYGTEQQLEATGWRVTECRNVWNDPSKSVDVALCVHTLVM